MPQLRWILLGLGLLLIAGLWWWESRRDRRTGLADEEREQERFEPAFEDEAEDSDEESLDADPLPSIRARHDEREIPATDPPIVVIDDSPVTAEPLGFEPSTPSIPLLETPVAGVDRRREPVQPPPVVVEEPLAVPAVSAMQAEAIEPDREDITVRTPVLRPAAASAPAQPPPPAVPKAAMAPSPTAPRRDSTTGGPAGSEESPGKRDIAVKQKIVAIRIVAIGDRRFDGPALRAALESEGLLFGKYAVFHREREDGRVLYSVASLVEPGSFNLEEMAKRDFPGVSLFAVFPGPADAPQVFDDMLATARRLAEQLGGALQDERRNTLSAQRVLSIREELAHFQHLVGKIRDRQAG